LLTKLGKRRYGRGALGTLIHKIINVNAVDVSPDLARQTNKQTNNLLFVQRIYDVVNKMA